MIQSGYALERISTGEQLAWWLEIPPRVDIPGEQIVLFAAVEGWQDGDYRIAACNKEVADPVPDRRAVSKSTIITRLNAAGLLGAASVALNADLYTRERWYAPDRPTVYADDSEALALLNAIGADPSIIMAPE